MLQPKLSALVGARQFRRCLVEARLLERGSSAPEGDLGVDACTEPQVASPATPLSQGESGSGPGTAQGLLHISPLLLLTLPGCSFFLATPPPALLYLANLQDNFWGPGELALSLGGPPDCRTRHSALPSDVAPPST